MHGKLLFKYGPMSSGKSLHLLATAHNFQRSSIPFVIFKSGIDNRDGEGMIHSRALGNRECITIGENNDLYELISEYIENCFFIGNEKPKWILVDKCQFLTEKQVDQLAAIADIHGINIICYGLRTDFRTKLFPGSKRLFEIADSFEEIKSSCPCGSKSIFNARIDGNGNLLLEGNQIEIGGDEKYIALCRKCYFEKSKKEKYFKEKGN